MQKGDAKMNKIKSFFMKHPKIRTGFDILDNNVYIMGIVSWIILGLLTSAFVLVLFVNLPEKFGRPISIIVGAIFTTLGIPLLFNNTNKKNEASKSSYEKCFPYYEEIVKQIINVLQCDNKEQDTKIQEFSKYLDDNYYKFCLFFPSKVILCIKDIKIECNCKNDEEAVFDINSFIYFSEKCFDKIRKHGDVSGSKIYINKAFINATTFKESKKKPQAPKKQ